MYKHGQVLSTLDSHSQPEHFPLLASSILIIEAQTRHLESITQILKTQGYRCNNATSGQEGLRYSQLHSPDLILLAISLPDFEGIEVCYQLKADWQTHDIPIIFILTEDETDKLPACLGAGAIDYVLKPVRNDDLITRIKLRLKIVESHRNIDLPILLEDLEIPTLFLDKKLNLLNFTNHTAKLFNLKKSNIGQHLSEISYNFDYQQLQLIALTVLNNLKTIEIQVNSIFGDVYKIKANPYYSQNNDPDGVYLCFIKHKNTALENFDFERTIPNIPKSHELLTSILNPCVENEIFSDLFEYAPIAYFKFDKKGIIQLTNLRGLALLCLEKHEIIGQKFHYFINQEDRSHFDNFLENIFIIKQGLSCELTLEIGLNNFWVRIEACTAEKFENDCLVAIWDITPQKCHEKEFSLTKSIFMGIETPIMVVNQQNQIISINLAFTRLSGYSKEELIGQQISFLSENSYDLSFYQKIFGSIAKQGHWQGEIWQKSKNGENFKLFLKISSIYETISHDTFQVWSFNKENGPNIIQSNIEVIKSALDQSHDAFIIFDENWHILFANSTAFSLFSLHENQLQNLTVYDLNPLFDIDNIAVINQQLVDYGHLIRETHHKSDNGKFIAIEISFSTFIFNNSRMTLALCKDISEREQIDNLIEDRLLQENRLSKMADHIPGFLYIFRRDIHGNFSLPYASAGIHQLYGLQSKDIFNNAKALIDFTHQDDKSIITAKLNEAIHSLTEFEIEFRIFNPIQGIRWVKSISTPVKENDGSIIFYGVMIDISKQKQEEETLNFIAQRGWLEKNQSFLNAIATYLARQLNLDYVLISKSKPDLNTLETVVWHAKGLLQPNFTYSIPGLGIENFLECGYCSMPQNIQVLFPKNKFFQELDVQSLICLPLWNYDGTVFGLLKVMHTKSIPNPASIISLLQLVASSIAAELLRIESEKKLAKSSQFLKQVIDSIADPIFVKDRQHRWILLNQAFCEFIGYPISTLLNKSDMDFFPANEASIFIANDELVFHTGLEKINEEAFTDKQGLTHTIVSKKTCYTDERGQQILVGVIRDITEQKQLAIQLAKQTQALQNLLENAPDNIIRYDNRLNVSYMNQQLIKSREHPLEKKPGFRASDGYENLHPAMQGYFLALQRVLVTGQSEEYILEIDTDIADKTIFDNIRFSPEIGENGEILGAIVIGRNYSRQRQLELQLSKSEKNFRTLAENSPGVIVRYDQYCRRIYVNKAYLESLSATENEVLFKTPLDFWRAHRPSADQFYATIKRVMAKGVNENIEIELDDANENIKVYALHLVPEFEHNGEISSVLALGYDITEIKNTSQRLEESRSQLRTLIGLREQTREEERKRISRELHDELGQRLTTLRLDVARIRLRFAQESPGLLEQVSEMLASIDSTILIVRNVASALRPAVLDMGITPAIEWLINDFGKRSSIVCDFVLLGCNFSMDNNHATTIFRIVQESLTNIARHSNANYVRVSLAEHQEHYTLEIIDNGKGFDPELENKCSFGLIGMKERVSILGGQFSVETALGKGVKITAKLSNHHEIRNVS